MVVEYGGSGLAVNVFIETVAWHVESGAGADGSIGDILGRCDNGVRTNLSVRGVTIYVNGSIAASVSIATIVQGGASGIFAIDSGDDSIGILSTKHDYHRHAPPGDLQLRKKRRILHRDNGMIRSGCFPRKLLTTIAVSCHSKIERKSYRRSASSRLGTRLGSIIRGAQIFGQLLQECAWLCSGWGVEWRS